MSLAANTRQVDKCGKKQEAPSFTYIISYLVIGSELFHSHNVFENDQ